ncbi:MAG TPA: aromatic ring-hydroxylating dioxygenase subunit alpha [Thermoanaerobaculia bacterium]|nr:aromatic ring-hydroxylating dioxygenase subunit alpha [Thermoanaerobaculia bacterium]
MPIESFEPFAIDPDITRAATPPSRLYFDPVVYQRVLSRIFVRSWQWLGDRSAVKVPGQVQPVSLLEGSLDEPLLLTRDAEDRVHCLSNVCTHRGNLVAESAGTGPFLRCRYHGRRFGLDGRMLSMPEFERAVGFPTAADDLPRVPFGELEGFLFASLEPAFPLEELLAEVRSRVAFLPLAEAVFDPGRSRDYLVQANWALYCDNYLEGFHIPYVHAALAGALDYGSYRTELYPYASLQVGVASGGEEVFQLPASSPDHGQSIAAYYYFLFPNTMLNFYPWGLSVNVVKPLAVDRTRVSFLTYVWAPEKLDRGAGAGLDRVEREDERVVESVQRGVRSRLYDRGRYSPDREQGVHHFHGLLARFLRD